METERCIIHQTAAELVAILRKPYTINTPHGDITGAQWLKENGRKNRRYVRLEGPGGGLFPRDARVAIYD